MNEEQINALANILKEIFTPKEFIKVKDNMLSILDARLKKPEPKLEPSDEEAKLLQREANLKDDIKQLTDSKNATLDRLAALKQEMQAREYQLKCINDCIVNDNTELEAIHKEWISKHQAKHVEQLVDRKPIAQPAQAKTMPKVRKNKKKIVCFTEVLDACSFYFGKIADDDDRNRLNALINGKNQTHATICNNVVNITMLIDMANSCSYYTAAKELKALYDFYHDAKPTATTQLELGI